MTRPKWYVLIQIVTARREPLSSEAQLSLMIQMAFLIHSPVTASACGQNVVRGCYVPNYQLYETWSGE